MSVVVKAIPDVDILLSLSPEKLGAKLLFLAKERQIAQGMFYPSSFENEIWEADTRQQPSYPRNRRPEIAQAFSEAWGWLGSQNLIVPAPNGNGQNGYRVLSRRVQHFKDETDLLQTMGERSPQQSEGKDDDEPRAANGPTTKNNRLSRKVFVVHGHDDAAKEKIARFLEHAEFEPIILHEQASRGRTVIEKVEAHGDVGFAVVLLTPDDEGCEKGGRPRPRARQNVVLELGYFLGCLNRTHVCALKRGDVEIPSDFEGVVYVPFDASDGWKQALGRELVAAGFAIDWAKAMGG